MDDGLQKSGVCARAFDHGADQHEDASTQICCLIASSFKAKVLSKWLAIENIITAS